MIRRQFIKLAALTGATGIGCMRTLGALERKEATGAEDAKETKTIVWRVHGFTCVTCAVGLAVMLRQQNGVKSVEASYPNATVTIQFHPETVSEGSLRSFIADTGFTTEEQRG
jgi:Cu+-exporting ATPase